MFGFGHFSDCSVYCSRFLVCKACWCVSILPRNLLYFNLFILVFLTDWFLYSVSGFALVCLVLHWFVWSCLGCLVCLDLSGFVWIVWICLVLSGFSFLSDFVWGCLIFLDLSGFVWFCLDFLVFTSFVLFCLSKFVWICFCQAFVCFDWFLLVAWFVWLVILSFAIFLVRLVSLLKVWFTAYRCVGV